MALNHAFRRVLFSLAPLTGFWLALLVVTAIGGDVYNYFLEVVPRSDDRAGLPNFPDKDQSRRVFADQKKTVEEYVPYLEWRRTPMATGVVDIDDNGYRIHHLGHENDEAGARSVGFFGGSTIWGTGVADDDTIPAIFDQLTTDYEVTNYGESGHTTRQMFDLLVNLISTHKMPKVVVFYDGFNHIWTHCNYAVTRSLNGHMAETKLRRALTEHPRFGYFYSDIIAPPIDFFRRIIGEKKFIQDEFACHDDPVRAEQVAETLLQIWEMAHTLVTANGGEFYAFLQPVAYVGEPRLDHLQLDRKVGAEQFRTVYPIIQTKLAERHLDYVTDLTHAYDGNEYIYIDDAHVSRNGNAIIAQRMLARLRGTEPAVPQNWMASSEPSQKTGTNN